MIVSHRHRFVFLKTEKTGSTSVERALLELTGEGDIWPSGPRPRWGRLSPALHGALTRRAPELFGLHAHARAAQIRSVIGPEIFDSYLKITTERNPWDRQVSLYTHRAWKRGKGPEGFDSFMRSRLARATEHCHLENWGIYTIGGRVVADRVLRYEHLATDFAALMAELGIAAPPTLGRWRSYAPARPHYSRFYSALTRDLVARWYAREIAHFGYVFETPDAETHQAAA